MADRLVYKTESDEERNEILFRRTIRGIPTLPAHLSIKNESLSNTFKGTVFVVPAEGQSYSEDLYISEVVAEGTGSWQKRLYVNIPPREKFALRLRVLPHSTPDGSTGRATVLTRGNWIA